MSVLSIEHIELIIKVKDVLWTDPSFPITEFTRTKIEISWEDFEKRTEKLLSLLIDKFPELSDINLRPFKSQRLLEYHNHMSVRETFRGLLPDMLKYTPASSIQGELF